MKTTITISLFFLAATSSAQSASWTWAINRGGQGNDEATCIRADLQGNIYTIGNYNSDSLDWVGKTIYNGGKFIVKHKSDGSILWAKNIPGGGFVTALDVDGSGNAFVTGYFVGHGIQFGVDTISTDTNGTYDMFLMKYDSAGTPVWAKTVGKNWNERSYAVRVDNSGNIFIAGSIADATVITLKYDSLGNVMWEKTAHGNVAAANGIATDNYGNCFIIGNYAHLPITFGSITLGKAEDEDVFIVKYDTNGDVVWAKNAGGTDKDWGQAITIDNASNLIISGSTASPVFSVGALHLSVSNAQWFDIFTVKMDSSGNVLWGRRFGGMNNERGNAIAIDGANNIYIAGQFATTVLTLDSISVNNAGSYDLYVVKYSPLGSVLWVKVAGSTLFDIASSIAVSPNGRIYICGRFISDNLVVGSVNLVNNGMTDIFIAAVEDPLMMGRDVFAPIQFSVHPNPFTKRIVVGEPTLDTEYLITNGLGKVVWRGANIHDVDFSFLPGGIYVLSIIRPGKQEMIKLIKNL